VSLNASSSVGRAAAPWPGLVFNDSQDKELVNVPIRVRGSLLFSSYQGGILNDGRATVEL